MTKKQANITIRRQVRFSAFPVTVDPLLPLVIVLMAWLLSQRYFPELIYSPSESVYWLMGISSALFLTISIFIHEVGHAYMAKKMRLPLERIHLFLFGGMAELRRRPVMPRQELWIALAGPVASVMFAFACLFVARLLPQGMEELYLILQFVFFMNLLLGLFNLLPVFPLDGGRALRALLWKQHLFFDKASRMTLHISVGVIIGLFIATGFTWIFGYTSVAIWTGPLAVYLLYTAWSGRKELLYEPDLKDLIFDFNNIDDIEAIIEEIAGFGEDYVSRCVFPITRNGLLIKVLAGTEIKKNEHNSWSSYSKEPEMGDFVNLDEPEKYQEFSAFSAEFVPVILDGIVAGLCDAHEMRFWILQQKQNEHATA